MAVNRFYSNTAVSTTLTGGINNSVTSIVVGSVSGFPVSFPYTLVLDFGTASEELVSVSAAAGTTLTVTRGADSTTATTHSAGATVKHTVSARDFSEPQVHMDSSAAHGATGAVVGTTNTQALTNKTIAFGSNTVSGTLAQFNTAVTDADLVSLAGSEVLTNKTLTTPTLTSPAFSGTATGVTSLGGVWSTYTPTWSGQTGTPPALGNGSMSARYFQIGKIVHFWIKITGGTTTTFGSGTLGYTFTLPVAPRDINDGVVGLAWASSSAGRFEADEISMLTSNRVQLNFFPGVSVVQTLAETTTAMTGSANGTRIHLYGTYEAA